MKKFLALILSIVSAVTVFAFSACGSKGDVNLKYYNTAADLIPALSTGAVSYGLLPEPAATNLEKMTKADGKTWYRLDIQELYDSETKSYPQAVVLIKESLLNTFPTLVENMKDKFSDNAAWVIDNPNETVSAVYNENVCEEGVTPSFKNAAILTEKVVNNCNISWQSAQDAKKSVKDYLNSIIAVKDISATAATDDFFYDGTAAGEFTADTVKVYAPDGAPALAFAKFIAENETFGTGKTFEYHVVAADKIGATGGDIVIMPVNLASKRYKANELSPYKMVSVVTHGNVYLMCSEEISANDLKDKTLGVFNMGGVPDLTLQVVLQNLGYKIGIAD